MRRLFTTLILFLLLTVSVLGQTVELETKVTTTSNSVKIEIVGGSNMEIACSDNQTITQFLTKEVDSDVTLSETERRLDNLTASINRVALQQNSTYNIDIRGCNEKLELVRTQLDSKSSELESCLNKPDFSCADDIREARTGWDAERIKLVEERDTARKNIYFWAGGGLLAGAGLGYGWFKKGGQKTEVEKMRRQ